MVEYAVGLFLAKYDSNGALIFYKRIAEGDSIRNITMTFNHINQGYITINFQKKLYLGNDTIQSRGLLDIFLLKFDQSGSVIHTKHIGNVNGEEQAYNGITIDENNNYYLSGLYNYNYNTNTTGYSLGIDGDTLTANKQSLFISKFDSNDAIIWSKTYTIEGDNGINILRYYEGNLYASFRIPTLLGPRVFDGVNYNISTFYSNCNLLLKLDTLGKTLWIKNYGDVNSLSTFETTDLIVNGNKIFFCGNNASNDQCNIRFQGGPSLSGQPFSSGNVFFIACYDTTGHCEWSRISPGVEAYLNCLISDSKNRLLAMGHFYQRLDYPDDTLNTRGWDDPIIFSYSDSGQYQYSLRGYGNKFDRISSGYLTSNNKILFSGTTSSDSLVIGSSLIAAYPGCVNVFFGVLDSSFSTAIQTIQPEEIKGCRVYPNPTNDVIYIEQGMPNFPCRMALYTISGQRIMEQAITHVITTVSVNTLPPGVYVIHINGRNYSSRKLIQRIQ